MDFYEAVIKYEDLFGELITYNLQNFVKKLKELNKKDNITNLKTNIGNEDNNKKNKNIDEIIKEIEASNRLKQIIQMKYNIINKNKYYIYAKNSKKKININYNNQKGIINNNIKLLEFNKDILQVEIKNELKKKIKEKYIERLNKLEDSNIKNKRNDIINNELKMDYSLTEKDTSESINVNHEYSIRKRIFSDNKFYTNNVSMDKNNLTFINDNLFSNTNKERDFKFRKNINIFRNIDREYKHNKFISELSNMDEEQFNKNNINNKNYLFKNKEIKIKLYKRNKQINQNNKTNDDINQNKTINDNAKKIGLIRKYKIGKNSKYNNNIINKKKINQIIKIKPEIKQNTIEKCKILFKEKRILSSGVTIKEEDNLLK